MSAGLGLRLTGSLGDAPNPAPRVAPGRSRARAPVTRVRGVSSHTRRALDAGWEMARVSPGSVADAGALTTQALAWTTAVVPGTVAASLRATGEWNVDARRDFDAEEWWYRCTFDADGPAAPTAPAVLVFGGLATIADVWLNDVHVLGTSNMFAAAEVDVSDLLARHNRLVLRFHALSDALNAVPRVPRPRWRTRLVPERRLGGVRTALIGRIPDWAPVAAPVGPWRPITLEYRRDVVVEAAEATSSLDGDVGLVAVSLTVSDPAADGASMLARAELRVGEHATELRVAPNADGRVHIEGTLRLPGVPRWWPFTHGPQPLFTTRVLLAWHDRDPVSIDLGQTGFRVIDLDPGDLGGFAVRVNGTPVFCRGACWTPLDVVRLSSEPDACRAALQLVRDAGMNMLRVGGPFVYEDDTFHDLCDALGILVWQDWMFASLDYPAASAEFAHAVRDESQQLLARMQGHASTAVLCGGSETAQQPAMLGLPRARWENALFTDVLPALAAAHCPGALYVPSSPWGGVQPFSPDEGVTHYFGVGAFMRPLSDAVTSGVRFATECLGFANVPEPAVCDLVPGGRRGVGHAPGWKARVHRDAEASYDLEDVRDHYLQLMFGVDARQLRVADVDRYLALSRVVTGEVMARVVSDWRRPGSRCRGALVWILSDLWPGAGCGLIDARGEPKAALHALRRACSPIALLADDRGLNGLAMHAVNDTGETVAGTLDVRLFKSTHAVARGDAPVTIPPHGHATIHVDALLGGFRDVAYAYRFGPPWHDMTVATLTGSMGTPIAQAFHFPGGLPTVRSDDLGIQAIARPVGSGEYDLTVETRAFAQAVAIDATGFRADDSYFHLAPGSTRTLRLRRVDATARLAGHVWPLNAVAPTEIIVSS